MSMAFVKYLVFVLRREYLLSACPIGLRKLWSPFSVGRVQYLLTSLSVTGIYPLVDKDGHKVLTYHSNVTNPFS
jgi:hypothetical protein